MYICLYNLYIVTRSKPPPFHPAWQPFKKFQDDPPGHLRSGPRFPPSGPRRGGEYWNRFHAKLVILYAPRSALKTKRFLLKESGGVSFCSSSYVLGFLVFFSGEFLPRCSVKRIKKKV